MQGAALNHWDQLGLQCFAQGMLVGNCFYVLSQSLLIKPQKCHYVDR